MHLSEALGVAYNFVKLKLGTVKIKDFKYKNKYMDISQLQVFFHLTTINLKGYPKLMLRILH